MCQRCGHIDSEDPRRNVAVQHGLQHELYRCFAVGIGAFVEAVRGVQSRDRCESSPE